MPKGTILQLQSTSGANRGNVRLEVAEDGNLTFTSKKSTDEGKNFSDAIDTSSIKFGNTEIKKNSVVMADAGTISINDCVISVDSATGAIQTKKGTGGALKSYADKASTESTLSALTTNVSNLQSTVTGLQTNGGTGQLLDEGKAALTINSKATGNPELKLANIDSTVQADSVFARFYDTTKANGNYADKALDATNGVDIQVSTLSLLDVLKYAASIEKELRLLREAQFPE